MEDVTPGTVRARPASSERLGRLAWNERVGTSMWWTPSLFVLAAIVITVVVHGADHQVAWADGVFGTDTDSASTVAVTVATGMLTFVGVVFSTTLVAVQLASAQYSPRVVRVFVRSPLTHVTLGVFLATFVFAIGAIADTRGGRDGNQVPTLTITLLYVGIIVTLFMFVWFMHGFVRLLRVQYLLTQVADEGRVAIDHAFPPADAYTEAPAPDLTGSEGTVIRNTQPMGVIQAMDVAHLARLAQQHDAVVELLVGVGEYVARGTPIARVHGPGAASIDQHALIGGLLLGRERTMAQDPSFALRQLVDIASRALSPAVNDPTTGVQAIDRVVDVLSTVTDRPEPTGWYLDDAGVARVHRPEADFERLARLGFSEIALYGASAPQVSRRLLAAFTILEAQVTPDRAAVLEELCTDMTRAVREAVPAGFQDLALVPDRYGLG